MERRAIAGTSASTVPRPMSAMYGTGWRCATPALSVRLYAVIVSPVSRAQPVPGPSRQRARGAGAVRGTRLIATIRDTDGRPQEDQRVAGALRQRVPERVTDSGGDDERQRGAGHESGLIGEAEAMRRDEDAEARGGSRTRNLHDERRAGAGGNGAHVRDTARHHFAAGVERLRGDVDVDGVGPRVVEDTSGHGDLRLGALVDGVREAKWRRRLGNGAGRERRGGEERDHRKPPWQAGSRPDHRVPP